MSSHSAEWSRHNGSDMDTQDDLLAPKNCDECGSSAYDVHMILSKIKTTREWTNTLEKMNSSETAYHDWVIKTIRAGIKAESDLYSAMSQQNCRTRVDVGLCYGYLDQPLPRSEPPLKSATDNAAEGKAGDEDQSQ